MSVKPREDTRGQKSDRALTEAPADVYLHGADYAPILTPDFDAKILEAASIWPDGIGVVYTQMCDELVPMLQAPTARYVELVGHTYNHDYPFWFIDHEMADIAWHIGRINFADVCVDQKLRPSTTTRLRDVEFWAAYYDLMRLERRDRARRIIRSPDFQAPEWFKDQLYNWYPLVAERSKGRNRRVRSNAKAIEAERGEKGPPDDGYVRAKLQAEQKLMVIYNKNTALRAAA